MFNIIRRELYRARSGARMGQIGGNKKRKCAAAREEWNGGVISGGYVNMLAIVDNAGADPSCARGPREVQCDLGKAGSVVGRDTGLPACWQCEELEGGPGSRR